MRVIHLIGGGDTGGAKTHVLNLLKELNNRIDTRLVCFRKGEFSEDAESMGIPIEVIDSSNPLVGLRELKKLIGDNPVDVIHCHGARGNLMGNLIKRFAKAQVVTTVHSDYRLDYLGRPLALLSYGTTNMLALRRMDYYISVSATLTDVLIERNFPADRIYTIFNGIDFNSPITCVPKEEFLRSIGLSYQDGDVVAGIAARLTPVKDHSTLLKAMKLALDRAPRLKLAIAGDGEDREKLEALTRSLGIEDRVCFAGWVKDMNSFFGAIDINLLTSISEGFAYVLTEGARMRCATIASRVGSVPDFIDNRTNGLIFEPTHEEELAEHLVTLANNPALRAEMGDRLYQKAASQYSIDRMVALQLEIYDNILKRKARKEERKGRRDGVVICGAYGHGNVGDDAILKSILHSIREMDSLMPVTVLAKNTEIIKKRYGVDSVRTLDLWKMAKAMKRSRLYVNGGGSLIQNATSQRSLWYYLFTLRLSKLLGNKVDMYGCGIGPVSGKRSVNLVRRVLDKSVDTITLREPDSLKELSSFGVRRPETRLCSDPALALSPAPAEDGEAYLKKHGLSPDGKYLCFMLRNWNGFPEKADAFAKCASYAYKALGLTPVFLSLNVHYDTAAAKLVTQRLSCPFFLLEDSAEPELLASALSRMEAVVSMRLHGLILSSLSGVPLVGVSYDPKIESFLKYLGAGQCIDLKDVTTENLRAAVDEAAGLCSQRETIREKALRLKEVERGNIEAVKRLLEI